MITQRLKPQTYAITILTHGRHRHFQRTANAELFIYTLTSYRDAGKFLLHGFVVMPDHIHTLMTPSESIAKAIQLIKGGYSHAVRQQSPGEIWHTGYHEHRIRDLQDFEAQKQYIANNPIRKGHTNYPHVHTANSVLLDPPSHLMEQLCS
ncbi:MAG TPA: transposase [Edaphobacter sp.]|jgi:putative transposase|nr:transposase [Edaphobacter sp.]